MSATRWSGSFVLTVLAALAMGGCSGTTKGSTRSTEGAGKTAAVKGSSSRCDATGKQVIELDINQDKQPDVWKLFAARLVDGAKVDVLTCKERDLNFDGRKDLWYHYDDDGNVTLEEMDLDFDGRVDLVTIRRQGKIVRQEMDTDHNGTVDVWKQFEEAVLVRIERDTKGDGRVDYWEYYEGGQLDRIGYDRNGDGRVDHWDRAPAAAAAKPAQPEEGKVNK